MECVRKLDPSDDIHTGRGNIQQKKHSFSPASGFTQMQSTPHGTPHSSLPPHYLPINWSQERSRFCSPLHLVPFDSHKGCSIFHSALRRIGPQQEAEGDW